MDTARRDGDTLLLSDISVVRVHYERLSRWFRVISGGGVLAQWSVLLWIGLERLSCDTCCGGLFVSWTELLWISLE